MNTMQRFCMMLDLRPDPVLVEEYVQHHRAVWPEIQQSIQDAGVLDMQIYCLGTRLFMIMDTSDEFTLQHKAAMDAANPKVLEWEELMGRYQQVEAGASAVTRWMPMDKIFQLTPVQ